MGPKRTLGDEFRVLLSKYRSFILRSSPLKHWSHYRVGCPTRVTVSVGPELGGVYSSGLGCIGLTLGWPLNFNPIVLETSLP